MHGRSLLRGEPFASTVPSFRSTKRPWVCSSCRVTQLRVPPCTYATSSSISAADLQFGQPLHETHPHILNVGERELISICILLHSITDNIEILVTPGIPALEYARRRTALAQQLPANSIAVVAAARVKYKSGAVFYPFHQDSNFFYLTG